MVMRRNRVATRRYRMEATEEPNHFRLKNIARIWVLNNQREMKKIFSLKSLNEKYNKEHMFRSLVDSEMNKTKKSKHEILKVFQKRLDNYDFTI